MSLSGALQVGKSALAVTQAALQVTGNNIANAGNPDYTRQVANLEPSRDQQLQPGFGPQLLRRDVAQAGPTIPRLIRAAGIRRPIRERAAHLETVPNEIDETLAAGADRARHLARETLDGARERMGF